MTEPSVLLLSYWHNDARRDLATRAKHLLAKTYPGLRWLWVVGDCTDDGATERALDQVVVDAGMLHRVTMLVQTTGVKSEHIEQRRRHMSAMMTRVYEWIGTHIYTLPELTITHESDVVSPRDVVEQLVAHYRPGEADVIGGWPILDEQAGIFYDTWAYRAGGVHYINGWPHHDRHRKDEMVRVDSIGTVYLVPTMDLGGRVIRRHCVVELCNQLRESGLRIWYDPRIVVEHRADLWEPTDFGREDA